MQRREMGGKIPRPGGNQVMDYTSQDFAKKRQRPYDIIFDTVGKISFSSCKNALKTNEDSILQALADCEFGQMAWTSMTGGKESDRRCLIRAHRGFDFHQKLAEAGKIKPGHWPGAIPWNRLPAPAVYRTRA